MRLEFHSLNELDDFLRRWERKNKLPRAVTFEYLVTLPDRSTFTCRGLTMQDITVGKQVAIEIRGAFDKYGNPAEVQGSYQFTAKDSELTVIPNPDGKSALLRASTRSGVSSFSIAADVDLGEGVELVEETVQVNRKSDKAATFNVAFGPEENPPLPGDGETGGGETGGGETGGGTGTVSGMVSHYDNKEAFDAATLVFPGPEGVELDGVPVLNGDPVLHYVTKEDGSIDLAT